MSLMPIFYNVYKGLYAVAHTLNNILSCNKTCNNKVQLNTKDLNVTLTSSGLNLNKEVAGVCQSCYLDNRPTYF